MIIRKVKATRSQEANSLRVAAYCRVSTGKHEQEDSLETQQKIYTSYIESMTGWELAGIYSDVRSGLSAEKRAGFMRMMQDAQTGKIDLILCKSISRFSRNIVECQRFVEKLRSRNIPVVFEKEHIRTTDPTSSWVFSMMCAVAQDESRSISENIKSSHRHRVEQGIYTPHKNHMLGYDVENGKYVPNDDAWIVRKIFDMYAEGKKIAEICDVLNKAGARRLHSDKPMSHQVIQSILDNETEVGDKLLQTRPPKNYITKRADPFVDYRTKYLSDEHCAIISRDIWNRVQKRRSEVKGSRKSASQSLYQEQANKM